MTPKLKLIFFIAVMTVLSMACGHFEVGIEDTPNANTVDPIQNSAEDELPVDCQINDYLIYIDQANGFCFAYPENFFIAAEANHEVEVQGPAVGEGIEPVYAKLVVNVEARQTGISLREQAEAFLDEFSGVEQTSLSWSEVEIDGQIGWRVEPVPVYLSWRIIFTESNGHLYRLMYWPVDLEDTAEDLAFLYQVSTQTFRFFQ